MKPDITPTIHSFIIRFVLENALPAEAAQPVYYGAIRHIQSAEEQSFDEWHEAVEFMRRFVPIEDMNEIPNSLP